MMSTFCRFLEVLGSLCKLFPTSGEVFPLQSHLHRFGKCYLLKRWHRVQGKFTWLVRIVERIGRNLKDQRTFPLDVTNEEAEVQRSAQMTTMMIMKTRQFLTPSDLTSKGETHTNISRTPQGLSLCLFYT